MTSNGSYTYLRTSVRQQAKPRSEIVKISNALEDWNNQLHSMWLQKVARDPNHFDDATIIHGSSCKCCSRILYVEERKKK
jgi:hypothetical protein